MRVSTMLMGASAVAIAGATSVAVGQPRGAGQGVATYWMSADTSSGMAAMMGGGSAGMMQAMMGGRGMRPGSYAHNLTLQLGGSRRASGEPNAEHLPPAALQAGPSLPLVSPRTAPPAPPSRPGLPPGMERPRGRMLIYWGCGERARPGQPVVVDFASLTAGKVPPAFTNMNLHGMNPPSPARFPTYGEWPNQLSKTRIPAGGSLVGDHVIRGNYSPEIRFALAPGQDFLAPVILTQNVPSPSGSVPLVWRPVPGSRAWFLTAMGAGANGDMVIWSSSEKQVLGMGLDYLAQDEIARMVTQRIVLPGTADRCTVPAEVAGAARQGMLTVTAFGGEANFSQPARPARAPASWRPDWIVKLRTKSTHMGLLGMTMPGMDDEEMDDRDEARPRTKKEKLRRGLGKIFGQ